mmetsp:Transcript_16498/g.57725  ORF Transcript_16498/g.57725 Transcript_16498/m.57725 type:complete len:218 (-) Transcript_16498:41-694(-)
MSRRPLAARCRPAAPVLPAAPAPLAAGASPSSSPPPPGASWPPLPRGPREAAEVPLHASWQGTRRSCSTSLSLLQNHAAGTPSALATLLVPLALLPPPLPMMPAVMVLYLRGAIPRHDLLHPRQLLHRANGGNISRQAGRFLPAKHRRRRGVGGSTGASAAATASARPRAPARVQRGWSRRRGARRVQGVLRATEAVRAASASFWIGSCRCVRYIER